MDGKDGAIKSAAVRKKIMKTLPEWERKMAMDNKVKTVNAQKPHGSGPNTGEKAPLDARLLTMDGKPVTLGELYQGAGRPLVLSFGSCS